MTGLHEAQLVKHHEIRRHDMRPHSLIDALGHAPRLLARGLVKTYRYTFSPLIGSDCRHLPTCSEYADDAFARFGLWAGGWMTLARLCRCHPWGTAGLDFVPAVLPAKSHWYLPWRFGRWRGTNRGADARIDGGDQSPL
jgi:putative membrane protein insertion efficiency factor